MDSKVIIIDGNNLFSRGYFIAKNHAESPFKFVLKMALNLKTKFAGSKFIFTFDTTKSKRRLELYPEYKGNRKSSMTTDEYETFKKHLNDFIMAIKYCGFIVLEGYGYEADDYIACVVNMLKVKYEVSIVSTDSDLLQLVNGRIKVYDPIKATHITFENFEQVVEIKLKHFLDYKCMKGDTSDNIHGIDGIGEKFAKKFINLYGSYSEIVNSLKDKKNPGVRELSIINSKLIYDRNVQLMDLTLCFTDDNLKQLIKKAVNEAHKSSNPDYLMKILCEHDSSEYFERLKPHEIK